MDKEIRKIKRECGEEIQELVQRHQVEVSDAVDKTTRDARGIFKETCSYIALNRN